MTETIDTAQPEALRLADLMDAMDYEDTRAAAAELRRNWNALTMAVASAVSSNAELAALAAAEAMNAALTDDAARLDFMCNKPARFIDVEDGGWWRVYEDQAPPEAPVAAWRAIVTKHEQTPREAIDAAIQARAAASISTKEGDRHAEP